MKKKNKSNLLIPLVVILVLIAVLGFVLLGDSFSNLFKPKNAYSRVEGYPTVVESTKQIERTRRVVKSADEFKTLMKDLFDDENKLAVPDVDFGTSDLYVVTTELNDTKGFNLRIKSMKKDETKETPEYLVVMERQKPGKNCVNDAVTNVAIDIVKVAKNIGDVEFERVDKIIDCKIQ